MWDTKLPPEQENAVDAILGKALRDGRSALLEHEIYGIFKIMGIRTPVHCTVDNLGQVTRELLGTFTGPHLMVKVISPHTPHKARIGGIRKVVKEVDAVVEAMDEMRTSIPRHPSFNTPPKIKGFLLTEFVDYSKELGRELLIAIRENLAFGPVISFSKGGHDAEHFAKYYSPPNMMLTPLDRDGCRRLLENTGIILRYIEEGLDDFIGALTETFYRFSLLSAHYSSFSPALPGGAHSRYVINELEVNPIVFNRDGDLIALDGLGSFMPREESIAVQTEPDTHNLDAFFEPRGVAVAGVSAEDDEKMGNIIASLLHGLGRKDLFVLNPKGGSVTLRDAEYPFYKSLAEIDEKVDLVIVTVPARAARAVVADAAANGVKAAILIPGGFSEVSGDRKEEESLLEIAKKKGMRILGPNCLGVFYTPSADEPGLNCIFVPRRKLEMAHAREKVRNVALITQSGGLGVTLLDRLRYAISPRVVVSYGNQLDVDAGDLAAYLDKSPDIDVLALYIEGYKSGGGREFFNAVRNIKKPVIIYKAGRTDAGSRAAASHTASMAGDYEIAKAAFQQARLIIAESLLDYSDLVKTFALLSGKKVRGRNVAGVVNAGFESTYAADNLGGLTLGAFTSETREKLGNILPPFVAVNPFLDLTPMGDDVLFERCIQVLLEDPNVDSLLISMVPHTVALHTTQDEISGEAENVAKRILRQYHTHDKPIVVSILAGDMYNTLVNTLEGGGVPTFTTAERAMCSLNELVADRLSGPFHKQGNAGR